MLLSEEEKKKKNESKLLEGKREFRFRSIINKNKVRTCVCMG